MDLVLVYNINNNNYNNPVIKDQNVKLQNLFTIIIKSVKCGFFLLLSLKSCRYAFSVHFDAEFEKTECVLNLFWDL